MLNSFCVNLTRSTDDPDRATVAMVVANAAVASGGSVWVCSPCFKKRGYTDSDLVEGATIVGGAKLVEFLSNDGTGVSY
jgi:predicted peroxiredoxin